MFELSDRHGFAIASDECYSEIYPDESAPPLGALQAARALGRPDFRRLLMFSSLSKRSNAPGLRSGFVAGDASLIKPFLHYRSYHGGAMSETVQAASVAAWSDEAHVRENRARYRAKFDALEPLLGDVLGIARPEGGFYFWATRAGAATTRLSSKACTLNIMCSRSPAASWRATSTGETRGAATCASPWSTPKRSASKRPGASGSSVNPPRGHND